MLYIGEQFPAQLVERVNVLVLARFNCHGDQTIIAVGLALFRFLGLHNPDQARGNQAADGGRRIDKQEHVEWVTVLAQRSGQEAKVERKDRSGRKHLVQLVKVLFFQVLELVVATFWRLDDKIERIVLLVNRRQVQWHYSNSHLHNQKLPL
jgi:hypothetical protein